VQHPVALRDLRGRSLPAGVLVSDVADLSRLALVAFLRLRWRSAKRSELATWLFGEYLEALTIGRRSQVESGPSLMLDESMSEETAQASIVQATAAIERVLMAFHGDPDLSIAPRLLEQRIVEPIVDERGTRGFAPLSDPTMPLAARVLALVAAEMLTRPERLRGDLVVEESLDGSSIDIADRPIASGVGLRTRQTMPWRPSRDELSRTPGWPAAKPGPPPTLAELVAQQDRRAGHDEDD
jgi:hypothetical protein